MIWQKTHRCGVNAGTDPCVHRRVPSLWLEAHIWGNVRKDAPKIIDGLRPDIGLAIDDERGCPRDTRFLRGSGVISNLRDIRVRRKTCAELLGIHPQFGCDER